MQASQECNACIFCFKCRLSQCARCACCANHTQRANDTDHTQRAKYGSDDAQHQASRSKARLSRQGRLTRFYAKDNAKDRQNKRHIAYNRDEGTNDSQNTAN